MPDKVTVRKFLTRKSRKRKRSKSPGHAQHHENRKDRAAASATRMLPADDESSSFEEDDEEEANNSQDDETVLPPVAEKQLIISAEHQIPDAPLSGIQEEVPIEEHVDAGLTTQLTESEKNSNQSTPSRTKSSQALLGDSPGTSSSTTDDGADADSRQGRNNAKLEQLERLLMQKDVTIQQQSDELQSTRLELQSSRKQCQKHKQRAYEVQQKFLRWDKMLQEWMARNRNKPSEEWDEPPNRLDGRTTPGKTRKPMPMTSVAAATKSTVSAPHRKPSRSSESGTTGNLETPIQQHSTQLNKESKPASDHYNTTSPMPKEQSRSNRKPVPRSMSPATMNENTAREVVLPSPRVLAAPKETVATVRKSNLRRREKPPIVVFEEPSTNSEESSEEEKVSLSNPRRKTDHGVVVEVNPNIIGTKTLEGLQNNMSKREGNAANTPQQKRKSREPPGRTVCQIKSKDVYQSPEVLPIHSEDALTINKENIHPNEQQHQDPRRVTMTPLQKNTTKNIPPSYDNTLEDSQTQLDPGASEWKRTAAPPKAVSTSNNDNMTAPLLTKSKLAQGSRNDEKRSFPSSLVLHESLTQSKSQALLGSSLRAQKNEEGPVAGFSKESGQVAPVYRSSLVDSEDQRPPKNLKQIKQTPKVAGKVSTDSKGYSVVRAMDGWISNVTARTFIDEALDANQLVSQKAKAKSKSDGPATASPPRVMKENPYKKASMNSKAREVATKGAARTERVPFKSSAVKGSDESTWLQKKPSTRYYDAGDDGDESQVGYKHVQVIRGKKKRSCLPGHACAECDPFWNAVCDGNAVFQRKQFEDNSRHRAQFTPDNTPPDFWELSFIDEKRDREQKEREEKERRAKKVVAEDLSADESSQSF